MGLVYTEQFSCVWVIITWTFLAFVKYVNISYRPSLFLSVLPILPSTSLPHPPIPLPNLAINNIFLHHAFIQQTFIGYSLCTRHNARCWEFNGKARKNNLCHQESWGLVKKAGINFENSPIDGKLPLDGGCQEKCECCVCHSGGGELVWELREKSYEDVKALPLG